MTRLVPTTLEDPHTKPHEPGGESAPIDSSRDKHISCGVYVHVPFCRRRCPYCDFAFEVRPADPRFVAAVLAEVDARGHELPGPPSTLSFGGGTPSALPTADLRALVDGIRTRTGLVADAEVSLELNPEDIDAAMPHALVNAGFSRASLGVQSFDDTMLRWLGRAHDAQRARDTVAACVAAGLRTGVDLIVGVPGESSSRLHDDVAQAVALGVTHVSTYLLTVEPETPLVQLIRDKKRAAPDDDAQATAYEDIQRLLALHGFVQYEVSSFARPGQDSRHNRLYWQGGAYLGVGPSAHSMSHLDDGSVRRRHTTARLDAWIVDPSVASHTVEVLDPRAAFLEAVAFGLRDMANGVDLRALATRHRVDPRLELRVAAALALQPGHVTTGTNGRFHLTAEGARFADGVARNVLAADDNQR